MRYRRAVRTMAVLACAALTFGSVVAVPGTAAAGGPTTMEVGQQLLAPGRTAADEARFGSSVTCSGDWAAIGAPDAANIGCVYVATRSGSGWAVTQRIESPTQKQYGEFGSAVDMDGDVLVIGAGGDDPSEGGAAYVYVRSGLTWVYHSRLTPSSPQMHSGFGEAVAIDGLTVMVGAPFFSSSEGRVYVFAWNGAAWVQSTLPNPDPDADDYFGESVDVSGQWGIIGAPTDDNAGTDAGMAYLCSGSGLAWTVGDDFSTGSAGDWFGRSVAISGDTVIVGAPLFDNMGVNNCGAAWVFSDIDTLMGLQARLDNPTPATSEMFGECVALDGDTAVAGAIQAGEAGTWSGGAYASLRSGSNWSALITLTHPGITAYDNCGWSAAVSGTSAITGAPRTDDYMGAAYIFHNPKNVVHRFYNAGAGTHFFTDSAEEAVHVLATWPTIFTYEGVCYSLNPANNPQPLYRFYNRTNNSHFYTASPQEADHVIATWPTIFQYDGPTYSVTPYASAGKTPVYRFYNLKNGSHFFTASATEADHVIATWPTVYRYEGPAFWLGQ